MSKRRNHDAAFKARVALEALKGDRTVAELVAAARCSRCRAKIVGTYRIVDGRAV